MFVARPFLHRNWVCSGAAGALPDAPEALPGRPWTRSGPPRRRLRSPFWPKRHGGTPYMGKIVVKVDAFRTIFVFLAEKFRFLCCFSIFFVILGSLLFLHLNWVCSGAAGPPPRRSRTRSGPPRSAPGRRSDACWDVLLEKGPNGILTGGQMRGAHLRSCQKSLWTPLWKGVQSVFGQEAG